MTLYWIVVGDRGSHGGSVLTGSSTDDIEGNVIATLNSVVTCPRHGIQRIAGYCDDTVIMSNGQPVALEGAITTCGERLLAGKQSLVFSRRTSEVAKATGLPGQASISSSLAGATTIKRYFEQYRAIDTQTGVPVVGQAYQIELADGTVITGKTDAEGRTQQVATAEPQQVRLTWLSDLPVDGKHEDDNMLEGC
jgi:uncharacterized Zn-binding protein involved in type VI secretion